MRRRKRKGRRRHMEAAASWRRIGSDIDRIWRSTSPQPERCALVRSLLDALTDTLTD
jgi:hypothetical protein